MFDNINIDWITFGVGCIVGVIGSWYVCDLVYPINDKDED
jgi:hypothetical protein